MWIQTIVFLVDEGHLNMLEYMAFGHMRLGCKSVTGRLIDQNLKTFSLYKNEFLKRLCASENRKTHFGSWLEFGSCRHMIYLMHERNELGFTRPVIVSSMSALSTFLRSFRLISRLSWSPLYLCVTLLLTS